MSASAHPQGLRPAITGEVGQPPPQADSPHPPVAHHFENLEQQREAGTLGMWVFLGSEILFFGGLFTGYAALRSTRPGGFALGSQLLDPKLGAINTAVLLTSSLTMALAVWAAQTAHRRRLQLFLVLTLMFGAVFLGIKAYEWHHEYEEGLVPGMTVATNVRGEEDSTAVKEKPNIPMTQRKTVELFFVFYFVITGLHALHMIIGLGVLGVQLLLSLRGNFAMQDYTPVELSGLYWHFVDVVWIFVFPLLYLLRT